MCVAVAAATALAMVTGVWSDRSAMTSPLSASLITVPSGTLMMRFSAFLPWQRLAPPLAALGASVLALVAEVHQGGKMIVRHKDDVTAAAAIAAVRAASATGILTMEAHCAIAALARMEPDREMSIS